MDPMIIVGAVANVAGLVTFVDWAFIKSKAKRQKKPLSRSVNALDKLELSLREINTALQEKKNLSEVRHYIDILFEAKADLVKDLRDIGMEIPKEELPIVRGSPNEALQTMVNLCESGVLRARKELTRI